MKTKRIISIVLSLILVVALTPIAAFAEEVSYQLKEQRLLGLMDEAWEVLDATEAEAIEAGADPVAVTMAVYRTALQCELIDAGSFADLDNNGFSFKVSGMACGYDYRIRNTVPNSALDRDAIEEITEYVNTRNGSTSMDVLLVGPYYGSDGNFTDQYPQEALSIADATSGEVTELIASAATGPAIAAAVVDAGVVIYDSHGGAYSGSSYLCLTTGSGLTSSDYSNGWAYNGGSWHGIDGRYIANHVSRELPNNLFWMAICEGMKRSGAGVTGYALLDAGAGCVYGYSQSVTFVGDYMYEAAFWNVMKEGGTVAEAFTEMVSAYGAPDPYGDAYPIVMSPNDPFPANPDALQTVYCDWSLFGGDLEPIALTGFSLSNTTAEVHEGFTTTINFMREPENANLYELVWVSDNESIVTVNGNNRRVTISGVEEGVATVACRVMVDGQLFGSAIVDVTVLHYPDLNEAANVAGGNLEFTTTAAYPWRAHIDSAGMVSAQSGNVGVNSSSSSMSLQMDLLAEDVLSFDWRVSSESGYDYLKFYVNGTQYGNSLSGINGAWANVTYTVPSDGTYTFTWTYSKDMSVSSGDDSGFVKNVSIETSATPILGDVDGDQVITTNDALMILRYVLGAVELNATQLISADYTGDGEITLEDALGVVREALQLI